jgi:hypothetical protein
MGDPVLSHIIGGRCSIYLLSGDVQVAYKHNTLAQSCEVTDATVQGADKAITEVVAEAIAIRGRVDTKQHECWELQDQTASFGIKHGRIDAQLGDLKFAGIATNALRLGQLAVRCSRRRREYAQQTFLRANRCACCISGVDANTRVSFLVLRQAEVAVPPIKHDHVIA